MDYVEKVLDGVHNVFNLNAATLSGAIDIVVVSQEDGTLKSSPFHVRFGKLHLLNSSEKVVTIFVNDQQIELTMRLGRAGEAYFIEESSEPVPPSLAVSPVGTPPPTPKHMELKSSSDVIPSNAGNSEGLADDQIETLTSKLESLLEQSKEENGKGVNSLDDDKVTSGSGSSSGTATIPIPIAPHQQRRNGGMSESVEEVTVEENTPVGSPAETADKRQYLMSWRWGSLPSIRASLEAESKGLVSPPSGTQTPPSMEELSSDVPLSTAPTTIPNNNPNPTVTVTATHATATPNAPGSSTWTGKVSSLFRIFQLNPALEPQYLVRTGSTYELDNEELYQQQQMNGTTDSTATATTTTSGTLDDSVPFFGDMDRDKLTASHEDSDSESEDDDDDDNSSSDDENEEHYDDADQEEEVAEDIPTTTTFIQDTPALSEAIPTTTTTTTLMEETPSTLIENLVSTTTTPPPSTVLIEEIPNEGEEKLEDKTLSLQVEEQPTVTLEGESDQPDKKVTVDKEEVTVTTPTPLDQVETKATNETVVATETFVKDVPTTTTEGNTEENESTEEVVKVDNIVNQKIEKKETVVSSDPDQFEETINVEETVETNFVRRIREEVHLSRNGSPSTSPPSSIPSSPPMERTTIPSPLPAPSPTALNPLLTAKQMEEYQIEMSKCGHILYKNVEANSDPKDVEVVFQENLITYEDLCKSPELIFDSNIVFKIKDRMYPWSIASPMIVSLLVFHRNLDSAVIEKLERDFKEKIKAQEKKGSYWGTWWYWNRGNKTQPQTGTTTTTTATPSSTTQVTTQVNGDKAVVTKTEVVTVREQKQTFIKKSLRPTNSQLESLKLHPGPNQIRFSVNSKLQGTREVRATIYLWDYNSKIVISDIDGTITKSDVFGQILPIMGRDWSHSGVVQLYSNIKANNYHILYLTSRAIGQANITRGYITTLKQGDVRMPQGPVVMSPHRLLTSFNREVILRRPEEFKIACLQDIKSLFPKGTQPFYAGFGNRPTDALSYRTVGVPLGKIFTINYKGEISIVNYTYRRTFPTMNELINEMFPAINTSSGTAGEEWNQWNYWKAPIVFADDDDEDNISKKKAQK